MNTAMPAAFASPPREFSLMPFWFWNDELGEQEIARQMDDFLAHGVYGFTIHPRVGLPRSLGFMSERLLALMRFAVEQAARRDMRVFLYDEGMYPSGSASGQVVARNPSHRCRGLVKMDLRAGEEPRLRPDETLVAVVRRHTGQHLAIVDRPIRSVIRGLHYLGEGPDEDKPPAADLLNPESVRSFIALVYERFHAALGDHFGKTILGIFTDEPNPLGRCLENDVIMGTTGILEHVNRFLGYDFTPHLPCLWFGDEPQAHRHVRDYHWAVHQRLAETYFQPIHDWCAAHGVAWVGHPHGGSDIASQRFFDIPGQDLVWRWVLPKEPLGLEGPESTQAKVTSSAMIHLGRRRNVNECFGAYGHEFTWEEMRSLADWCFVRGVNMLTPHAFFYSVRGPRRDERPPDVGPHSPWWDRFGEFARYAMRLGWLNTDSRHVCRVAILADPDGAPWNAARICYQNQCDFNYLDPRHLLEGAVTDADGIRLAGMAYAALIVDEGCMLQEAVRPALEILAAAGRLLFWAPDGEKPPVRGMIVSRCPDCLIRELRRLAPADLIVEPPVPDLRVRHVTKDEADFYFLVNEGKDPIAFQPTFSVNGPMVLADPMTGAESPLAPGQKMTLGPMDTRVVRIAPL
jgi:hypothetical protein